MLMSSASPASSHVFDNRAARRVTNLEAYHRTDAAALDAVLNAATRGLPAIPVARTFALEQIGEARTAVANGARGKIVHKH